MDYAKPMTPKEMEYVLNVWATSGKETEDPPACLGSWDLDEDQVEIIKEACVNTGAAASIAHAMCCGIHEEDLAAIANALRYC